MMRALVLAALLTIPFFTKARAQAAGLCCAVSVSGSDSREPGALFPARRQFWIWIQPQSHVFGFQRDFPAVVREAFEEWRRAELPVDFAFVDDSTLANLFVFWRTRLDGRIQARGTWWTAERIGYTRGEVELAVGMHNGFPITDDLVKALALHEIGHLLGLRHRDDPGSIMSQTLRTMALPSADIHRARELYRAVVDAETARNGTR